MCAVRYVHLVMNACSCRMVLTHDMHIQSKIMAKIDKQSKLVDFSVFPPFPRLRKWLFDTGEEMHDM